MGIALDFYLDTVYYYYSLIILLDQTLTYALLEQVTGPEICEEIHWSDEVSPPPFTMYYQQVYLIEQTFGYAP